MILLIYAEGAEVFDVLEALWACGASACSLFPWAKYQKQKGAVKTQIWMAISVHVVVAIFKKKLQLEQSVYTILQILSLTCFEKGPIYQRLSEPSSQWAPDESRNQLQLFDL
jgi:hypothetical protein